MAITITEKRVQDQSSAYNIEDIINIIYPVGSIYISVNNTDPSLLFHGTWERIKDRFLLASGDTYSAGSTGGEAQHTLTVDEMPSHKHTYDKYFVANDPGLGSWIYDNQFSIAVRRSVGSTASVPISETGQSSGSVCHEGNLEKPMNTTGGSQPHNNMPPYLTVYIWKRVA